MAEIPKLVPEVEIPRPRSSGAAVVAVAALALFTAVGASAFVVRVRMGARGCHCLLPPRVASARAQARELRDAFLTAASHRDDQTALEVYRSLPASADPTGDLAAVREAIVARQMALLEHELAEGDCSSLRNHVEWLQRVVPEEGIAVRASECTDPPRMHAVEVELIDTPRAR